MIGRFERFSIMLTEVTKHWNKIASDEMEQYGLNGCHAVYLTILNQYEEGITAAKLGELCYKDKSDVSRMISVMEKKGLVKKERVHKNFYRALLKLTDEGKQAAALVQERAMKAVEVAGKGISEEKREVFYQVLRQISDNLQVISREGLPQ